MGKLEKRRRKRDAQLRGRNTNGQVQISQGGFSTRTDLTYKMGLLSPLARARRSMEREHSALLCRSSPKRSVRAISSKQRRRGLAGAKARLRQERASKGGL